MGFGFVDYNIYAYLNEHNNIVLTDYSDMVNMSERLFGLVSQEWIALYRCGTLNACQNRYYTKKDGIYRKLYGKEVKRKDKKNIRKYSCEKMKQRKEKIKNLIILLDFSYKIALNSNNFIH